MGFHILVRWRLYIESGPWCLAPVIFVTPTGRIITELCSSTFWQARGVAMDSIIFWCNIGMASADSILFLQVSFPETRFHWNLILQKNANMIWRWQGKRSQHSRRMRNPQCYLSHKRPMQQIPNVTDTGHVLFCCVLMGFGTYQSVVFGVTKLVLRRAYRSRIHIEAETKWPPFSRRHF